jgi:hypothetical protein
MDVFKLKLEVDDSTKEIAFTDDGILVDGKEATVYDCAHLYSILKEMKELVVAYTADFVKNTVKDMIK